MSMVEKDWGSRICSVQDQKTLYGEQKLTDQPKETQLKELEQLIASEKQVARDHLKTLLNRAKRERKKRWKEEEVQNK